MGSSPSSQLGTQIPVSLTEVKGIDDMSLNMEKSGLEEKPKRNKDGRLPDEYCKLCDEPLPPGYLDAWRDENGILRRIKMGKWTEICNNHKRSALQKVWAERGYPDIDWKNLKERVNGHYRLLEDIIWNKIPSPFRAVFAKQQKEIGGNAAKLLKRDAQLQYPGYYGPRGSNILYVHLPKISRKRKPLIRIIFFFFVIAIDSTPLP